MGRPKSKGPYVPLAAQYFMDDAILEAGPDAELLFVRCLSFLASVSSDGFITERQMTNIVGNGLRAVPRRVKSLVEVGLIEPVSGGFLVRSWLKWNKSADEIGKLLAKDRERKSRKLAEDDANSVRNDAGIQSDSEDQYRAVQSSTDNSPNGESSSDAVGADAAEYSDEVKRLCGLLAELVRANGHKVGAVGVTWWQACERLFRIDGYTAEQIEWLMRWATSDEFWAANIRSMPKFREKFSTLKAQAQANPHGRGRSSAQRRELQALELVARYEEEERNAEVGSGEGAHVRVGGGGAGGHAALDRGVA